MQVDRLEFQDHVLTATCSGIFGIGSEGNPSGTLLRESIEGWMLSHPAERVDQLVIDYRNVEYEWGDGPVTSMIPFVKRGVTKIRLVAGPQNLQPLRGLVNSTRLPCFVVAAG